jgi:hypothetical protein
MLKRFAWWVLGDDVRCSSCRDLPHPLALSGQPAAEVKLFPASGGIVIELMTFDPGGVAWQAPAASDIQRSFVPDSDMPQLGERISALYVGAKLRKAR